jgi:hypothetical protein
VVGEGVQAGFGGGVVRSHDPAGKRGARGSEQDSPEALLAHLRQYPAGEEEGGAKVDCQCLVEGDGVHLTIAARPAQPGVGRQHADGPEARLDLVDQPLGGIGVGEVRTVDLGPAACRPY